MDGFVSRGQVIVIGATNIPEVLDPALQTAGPVRSGNRDWRPEHPGPPADSEDSFARHAARAGRRPQGDCGAFPRFRRRRSRSAVPGSRHDRRCAGSSRPARLSPTPRNRTHRCRRLRRDLGALLVTRDDFLAGLRKSSRAQRANSSSRRVPSTFASLGGLDEVKRLLGAVVEHAHVHDDVYEQVGLTPPRGILLVGPSGTGKTADGAGARPVRSRLPLIAIDGPQLYSKWLGESEKALREVFKKARRSAPCMLFFDTIDAIAPQAGDAEAPGHRRLPAHSQPAAARDRQPPRRQRRDSAGRDQPSRTRRAGALAQRPLRLYRSVRQTRRARTVRRSFDSAAGRCRSPRMSTSTDLAAPHRRVHRRRPRKRCARRPRCWRLRNYQRGARGRTFHRAQRRLPDGSGKRPHPEVETTS